MKEKSRKGPKVVSKAAKYSDSDDLIFTPYFRHWITKKMVYAPPGKVFCFRKPPNKDRKRGQ